MEDRLILVVRLWIREDNVEAYRAYEKQAAIIMQKHGGRLEQVFRSESIFSGESKDEEPDEIHVVSFVDKEAFKSYQQDPGLIALREERGKAIQKTQVWAGKEVTPY